MSPFSTIGRTSNNLGIPLKFKEGIKPEKLIISQLQTLSEGNRRTNPSLKRTTNLIIEELRCLGEQIFNSLVP